MTKNFVYRLLSIGIAVAIVLAACNAPQPAPVPTRAAPTLVGVVVAEPAALVPTRVVTRPAAAQSQAPTLVGEHHLSDIGLVFNLNADGTASLDAPALETGAAARSWRGVWLVGSFRAGRADERTIHERG